MVVGREVTDYAKTPILLNIEEIEPMDKSWTLIAAPGRVDVDVDKIIPQDNLVYQFADDGSLLVSTRTEAERAVKEYQILTSNFRLSVSIHKSKYSVVGVMERQSIQEMSELCSLISLTPA